MSIARGKSHILTAVAEDNVYSLRTILSLGFEMAGFNIPLAVERDEWAAETYKFNHPNTTVLTEDITTIYNFESLLPKNTIIDGIIGGPPCQGFSLSGNRDKNDPRNSLFMDFVRFVNHFKPKFFVMENVTGILSPFLVILNNVVKSI